MSDREDERQFLHFFFSVCCIALVELFGVALSVYAVCAIFVIGLMLFNMRFLRMKIWVVEKLLERFERKNVLAGYGAMTFTAAVLLLLTLLAEKEHVLASLVIVGFGDAASTFFGRRSKRKLPYSKKKTYGGTAAFFIASLPAVYFAGIPALLVAALAALAESLDIKIDDNLAIATVCVVAFRLIG